MYSGIYCQYKNVQWDMYSRIYCKYKNVQRDILQIQKCTAGYTANIKMYSGIYCKYKNVQRDIAHTYTHRWGGGVLIICRFEEMSF